MWQLANGGVKAADLSFFIRIFIFVITCHLLFTPALEAKGGKPSRNPHGKPPGNSEQALKSKIAKMRQSPRVTNGNTTFSNSMCLILVEEVGDYYEWDYDEWGANSGLVISDRCVITRAYFYLNFINTPLTKNMADPASYTCYVPRDGCDTAYHLSQLLLSKSTPVDSNYQNDIAIFKTQKSMEIGKSICGQYPLFPAAVSCNRNGPPNRYSDCFLVGWGKKNSSEDTPQAEIQPNRIQVTTLTLSECEAVRNDSGESSSHIMNPNSQVCVKTVNGNSGYCDYDYNSVLYCKYWRKTTGGWGESNGGSFQTNGGWAQSKRGWAQSNGGWGQGSGGWGASHQGWQNPNKNWGWGKPSFEPQQTLAVGLLFYIYGSYCATDSSVSLVLKFGYEGYSDLFGSCGMTCSDSLPTGYECMEKWDPALGPVYCTPQRIQHNNGWKEYRRNPTHH